MKDAGEVMNILEAYDLVGSYRAAAGLAGCDHHTVKHYVERRDAGLPPDAGLVRPSIIDPFRAKIEEWVDNSHGKFRADVAHDKLVAMGFAGTDRTTRRAVRDAKAAYAAGRRRTYRPWIPEPGGWLQFDWGTGPTVAGRQTVLFCAWLAWSRFRVVIPCWDKTLPTVLACLDETFRRDRCGPDLHADRQREDRHHHACGGGAGAAPRHRCRGAALRHPGRDLCAGGPGVQGGPEATVKIAKADLVPTDANLREAYTTFVELRAETALFCDQFNARPHRETCRPPVDMLAEELVRLHPVPDDSYVAALGETRKVNRSSTISWGGTRSTRCPTPWSTPPCGCASTVDEIIVTHQGRDGVAEVARHAVAAPGNPQIDLSHYPPRTTSQILDHQRDRWARIEARSSSANRPASAAAVSAASTMSLP